MFSACSLFKAQWGLDEESKPTKLTVTYIAARTLPTWQQGVSMISTVWLRVERPFSTTEDDAIGQ